MIKNIFSNQNKPYLLSPSNNQQSKLIGDLLKDKSIVKIDELNEQINEYKLVIDPTGQKKINKKYKDIWVYYPWARTMVRILVKQDYRNLRLSRNNGFINASDQKNFLQSNVGIVGMNVGYHAAICLALSGGAEKMKFADPDILTVSSLNRFRASLKDLGRNKTNLTAEQVYEIDPFYKIELYSSGITFKNIDKFLLKPKVSVLIEEMDNLPLKIAIRKKAKKYGIPVIMVTGNGENLVLDIERFDINKKQEILNGFLMNKFLNDNFDLNSLSRQEKIMMARDFIGKKYLAPELISAFDLVGKDLAAIPQLAETSFLRGLVLSKVVRSIVLDKIVPAGRYQIKMDNIFRNEIRKN